MAWQGGSAGVGAHVLVFVACARRATRASVLTGGEGAVPSNAQVRALIKPVLELCPCRCVETAMITPENGAKKYPEAYDVAGNAQISTPIV